MSHEVESMFWLNTPPWHRLGTPIEEADAYDMDSCIIASGLGWTVRTQQCYIEIEDNDTFSQLLPVPAYATIRSSDNSILGVVGERYEVLQNVDAFRIFQPFLDSKLVRLNTAGSLFEGKKVWILAEIMAGDPLEIRPNDFIRKFILLSHGHDGRSTVEFGLTPIRVVCANTLRMAIGDKSSQLTKLKHTKNLLTKIENIRDTIDLINQGFSVTAEQYKLLARKPMTRIKLNEYIQGVFDIEDITKVSTRTYNVVEKIKAYFAHSPGAKAESFFDGYNAVTFYLNHNYGHNPESRLNNIWFGKSDEMNKKALELALTM